MNVTHKQLRAFVAVTQTRSFAEACGLVHLSQPALSIAIKNLEEAAGGRLLARTTRTLALTPEGEAFYPVAQRLLADWDDAMEDLHNHFALRRGKITVAAMPSFACNLLPTSGRAGNNPPSRCFEPPPLPPVGGRASHAGDTDSNFQIVGRSPQQR